MSETPGTADRMEMVGKGPGGRWPRPAFCRSASSAQPPLLCPSDGGGVSSQGSQETDKSSLWPTCFLVTETHQHFSSANSKPGHYLCPLVTADKATQETPGCVLGVTEAHTSLMLNLTPDLAELLRLQTREPYKVSLLSSCLSGLATAPQGWQAVVSPHSSLELVGHGGICFPSLWILFFEKQANNCLLEDGSRLHTRLQDGWSGGEGT